MFNNVLLVIKDIIPVVGVVLLVVIIVLLVRLQSLLHIASHAPMDTMSNKDRAWLLRPPLVVRQLLMHQILMYISVLQDVRSVQ